MPKTKRGKEIIREFQRQYGAERGKRVAYATAQKQGGKLYRDIHSRSKGGRRKRKD
jgi:hypothetical protein